MNILTILLKNLFRGAMTVRFPARPSVSKGYRGLVQFDAARCTGCSMCAFNCTSRAITFRKNKIEYKWSYDPGQCTFCGRCEEGCNAHALSMERACPPVYLAAGELRSAFTMQRKPPAARAATVPRPAAVAAEPILVSGGVK